MANEQNLIPFSERTPRERSELGRKGNIASTKAKKEKKTMKQMLEMCLEMKDKKGVSYRDLATIGLLKGAIKGDARNYKAIVETLGELKIPEQERQQQQLSKVEELLSKLNEVSKKE